MLLFVVVVAVWGFGGRGGGGGAVGEQVCWKKTVVDGLSGHPANHVLKVVSDMEDSLEPICFGMVSYQSVLAGHCGSWTSGF